MEARFHGYHEAHSTFLRGEGESDRDWLIEQEWYGVLFECLLADRMMLPLIVNHANDGIGGTSREVQASALRCNRISLIAEDQQASQPRQAPRLEGISPKAKIFLVERKD